MHESNETKVLPQSSSDDPSLQQESGAASPSEMNSLPEGEPQANQQIYTPPYYKPMAQTVSGNIRYTSGEELSRPVYFPRKYSIVLILFAIIGAVIGVLLFSQYYDNVIHGAERQSAQVQENLTRGVALNLPALVDYANLSDDEIKEALKNAGYEIHDISGSSGSLDVVKAPSDVSATEAALLLAAGVDSLSAVDASKLLVGLWRLDTSRTDGYTIRVRYADFTSGNTSTALASCLSAEKIDGATATEQGEDSSGNTYMTGTVEVGDVKYQWRASAIPLSSVYDIGLPSSSMYVGFKLTKIA